MACGLRVTSRSVFGKKELVHVFVHLEQTIAGQSEPIAVLQQSSRGFESADRLTEFVQDVDSEFALEVIAANPSELELQNDLANQALFRGGSQCPVDRQHALAQRGQI